MGRKSDDSSKFEHSFWSLGFFLLTYDHNASTDIGGWCRKIRLEQKSMTANFDVEVKNDEKMKNLRIYKINLFLILMINCDVRIK